MNLVKNTSKSIFENQWTVNKFKEEHKIAEIKVIPNPKKNNNLFAVADGNITMAVGKSCQKGAKPDMVGQLKGFEAPILYKSGNVVATHTL